MVLQQNIHINVFNYCFCRELDDSLKQKSGEEPFSYWSAPDLSAPRNISDSGKHSPGVGKRFFIINVCVPLWS